MEHPCTVQVHHPGGWSPGLGLHRQVLSQQCQPYHRLRWLCSATGPTIKVWDLESKNLVEELRPEVPGSARAEPPQCLSLAWSADGQTLFAGYSDNLIRVWQVSQVGSR